jgi:hypothetical protein
MSTASAERDPASPEGRLPGSTIEEGALLHLVATGLAELSQTRVDDQREDLRGLSRPSGAYTGTYPAKTQSAYNHVVLHCLRTGVEPPNSVPDFVRWAATRPIGDWPVPLPPEAVGSSAFLVDEQTRTPTLECLEWTVDGVDPLAEIHESQLMLDVLHTCRRLDLQDTYVAFRSLLIKRPILLASELARLGRDPDLAPLKQIPQEAYEPVPDTRAVDGALPLCARCNCLLHSVRGRWYCELDSCRARGPAEVGGWLSAVGENAFQIARPLRTFVTGPGLTEMSLLEAVRGLGLAVELWPAVDRYDLRITLPNGRVWAVEVKDWSNPGLLGRRVIRPPSEGEARYDEAYIVAPHYRFSRDRQYRERYRRARRAVGLPPPPPLLHEDEFLRRLESVTSSTAERPPSPTAGPEEIDA